MCAPIRERVVNPTPPVPAPPREVERIVNPDPLNEVPKAPPAPTFLFQADPGPSAADLNAEAAKTSAPQSLGGVASRFSVPVGKHGYSKSLRPEAGRLVR